MPASVSVVIPAKNRRVLLRETLDCLIAQTTPDWEAVVVDDGSDDGTDEDMAARSAADPRIRFVKRQGERSGANVCRNLGVELAAADLIVFLDSDDLLDPDCLERRIGIMKRNADLDFAVFRGGVFNAVVGDLGRLFSDGFGGDLLLRFLYFETPWQTAAPIWRKAAFERLGRFDETLLSWQDIDLHIRAITGGLCYLCFPEIDHHMRWHWEDTKVSLMQSRSERHIRGALAVVEKFERVIRAGPGIDWSRQRALAGLYFLIAEWWLWRGELREAFATWRLALERGLASWAFYSQGVFFLMISPRTRGGGGLAGKIVHKWKGWARLRSSPELVDLSGVTAP